MSDSDESEKVEGIADLQFEHAEVESSDTLDDGLHPSPALQCANCSTALDMSYFAIGDAAFCGNCKDEVVTAVESRTQPIRFLRALLYGVPAAMVGSGIYYAILAITDYEIGLVAILIGFMVGGAVRAASGPGGGRRFQLLAAGLTYCAIVTTYVPFVIEAVREEAVAEPAPAERAASEAGATQEGGPIEGSAGSVVYDPATEDSSASIGDIVIAFVFVFAIAFVAPFLSGFENIIGLFIIGFGVYQAWKMNKRLVLEITGPHAVGPQPAASA